MLGHQAIRAYFPADIGAMLQGLNTARPDLGEAWYIMAQQVGFARPDIDLDIHLPLIVATNQLVVSPPTD